MTHSRAERIVFLAVTAVLGVFLLAPILVVVAASFSTSAALDFPPNGLSLRWYAQMWSTPQYIDGMKLSLELAAFVATVSIVLGGLAAIGLSKSKARWAEIVSAFLLSPLVLPQVVIGAGVLALLGRMGLQGGTVGLIVGHIVITVPYATRTIQSALFAIDSAHEEASLDLYASRFTTYRLIVLPMIRSGIFAAWMFAFVISWINVEVSVFLAPSVLAPIPVQIFSYVQYSVDSFIAVVSAVSVYVAVVVILVIDRVVGLEKTATR